MDGAKTNTVVAFGGAIKSYQIILPSVCASGSHDSFSGRRSGAEDGKRALG